MSGRNLVRRTYLIVKVLCILLILSFAFVIDIPVAATETMSPAVENRGKTGDDSHKNDVYPEYSFPADTLHPTEPVKTDFPKPIRTPLPAYSPGGTEIPVKTEEPVRTAEPEDTERPAQTQKPERTPKPARTEQPSKTEGQEADAVTVLSQNEMNRLYKRRDRVAYLTFDDGPTSSYTPDILDILARENIKATFFIIGSQARRYPDIVRRQYREGHGIGNHTYTHAFKNIYASTDNYTAELYKTERLIQSILETDKKFRLTRFPGGSFGEKLEPFKKRVNDEGFVYIDWNCLTGDAESKDPREPEELVERFKDTAGSKTTLVVLMHDSPGKKTTVEALPEIIGYLKAEGYRFELLPGSGGH